MYHLSTRLKRLASDVRRNFAGQQKVTLLGRTYSVVYESRGLWTEPDYVILQELARGKRCIFDIGANKGAVSLIMASVQDPAGITVAFEASEAACCSIIANSALNQLDRIHVVNALVGAKPGQIADFLWDGASVFASMAESRSASAHNGTTRIPKPLFAIDDYVAQFGAIPDFVKVDVEGAERQVLQGMMNTMKTGRPLIYVEVHELTNVSVAKMAGELIEIVQQANYRAIRLKTFQEIADASSLEGIRGRSYLLLQPVEMPMSLLPRLETSQMQ